MIKKNRQIEWSYPYLEGISPSQPGQMPDGLPNYIAVFKIRDSL
jgi:hypothetical protein